MSRSADAIHHESTGAPLSTPGPAGALSAAARAELLAAAVWREPLEGYARATKLAVMMVDASGTPLGPCINPQRVWQLVTTSAATDRRCPFCLHPEPGCQSIDEVRRTGRMAFARDRAGLAHLAVPVKLGDDVLAVVLAGQVFDRFPEQILLDHLARTTGCSAQAIWDIARREAPVGRNLLQAYGELLSTLAESYLLANHAGIVDRQRYAAILGLEADLAERKQIESALRQADRRKDEFLATLAHELRNPLAPMMTAVHLLQRSADSGLEAMSERALATLNRQLRHMVRLVDDLLDFSRITRGHIDLQRQRVRLSEVVASAVETSRPEVDQRRHELIVDNELDDLALEIDPVRISQALANLLTNAARYMNPGGHIHLSVRQDGKDVALSVTDQGVGIAPEMVDHIFDMFVRGPSSSTAAPGGLGIGLTLSRLLVEMHDGRITVASEGLNRGSEFTIRLPMTAAATADARRDARAATLPPVSSRRILIVEDNDDAREMLTHALALKGHEVKSAGDGPGALGIVADWQPDVVILDIGLPGMSGHELARQFREQPALRDVVLIALTGWGQETDRLRSSAAGIAHHLTKPLDPDELDQLLGALTKA